MISDARSSREVLLDTLGTLPSLTQISCPVPLWTRVNGPTLLILGEQKYLGFTSPMGNSYPVRAGAGARKTWAMASWRSNSESLVTLPSPWGITPELPATGLCLKSHPCLASTTPVSCFLNSLIVCLFVPWIPSQYLTCTSFLVPNLHLVNPT